MRLKTLTGKHADPRKGRGAGINLEGRFETTEREAFDDGWSAAEQEELAPLKTQVTAERAKSIISQSYAIKNAQEFIQQWNETCQVSESIASKKYQ